MSFAKANKLRRSTTVRLALALMTLMSVAFLLLGAFLYWGMIQLMERDIWLRLDGELVAAQSLYAGGGMPRLVTHVNERRSRDDPYDEFFFTIADKDCQPIATTDIGLPGDLCEQVLRADGWYHFRYARDDAYARSRPLGTDHMLIAGVLAIEVESARYLVREILTWGLFLGISLVLIASMLMATSIERRLEPMNRMSRQIRLGNLSSRIPLRNSGDEFDRLAQNLNEMLDEIQRLMDGIRHVADTIAHDLRTPLTVLRGQLEDLRDEPDRHTMAERTAHALADVDRLLAIFAASLRIAQIEAGNRRVGFASIELGDVVAEVVDLYEPLADEKSLSLCVSSMQRCSIDGDRGLVFQAVSNLVDNAMRFAPPRSAVELALDCDEQVARISVSDRGPGIPEHERGKVLEKFYRLDRESGDPGAGLGLSLVAAVAKLHDGGILLEDHRPGLRAILVFQRRVVREKPAKDTEGDTLPS